MSNKNPIEILKDYNPKMKMISNAAKYSITRSKEEEELKKAKTDKERKRIKDKYHTEKVMAEYNMTMNALKRK